ncbi:MAG: GxxExxY protein [Burkholderiales bacterium]
MGSELLHAPLTEAIVGGFYDVYNELGHGFLESVYRRSLLIALRDRGLRVEAEVEVAVRFREREVGSFRADLVVEDAVVVELKVARAIDPVHEAQLLHYLKASRLEVGLLLNFGEQPRFKRLVLANTRKNPRSSA